MNNLDDNYIVQLVFNDKSEF